MIYRVWIGYDTAGEPIWEWRCNCEKCLTSTSPCYEVLDANFKEMKKGLNKIMGLFRKNKPQDTALYASLRR